MVPIGVASRQSGVHIETIRYYEREGVVPRPVRGENKRRMYSADDIGRLRLIKRCRNLGFSLVDAKLLLSLSEHQQPDCNSVGRIAKTQADTVRQKIRELKRLERALHELSSNCAEGNVLCPILSELKQPQT